MSLVVAINDIKDGLKLFRYWIYLAFIKTHQEYKKTSFSLLWPPLTIFFVALVLSLIWGQILKVESQVEYFFYILIGFALWSVLLSRLINRGVSSLSRRSKELSDSIKPISLLPLEDIAYCFIHFLLVLPFILVASFLYYGFFFKLILVFTVGVVLTWVTSVALSLSLGVYSFFYRDILQITQAIMRLGFVATPIIWYPEKLGEYEYLVWFNPFYSYIDICRSPLMGQMPHDKSILVVLMSTLVLSVMAVCTMSFNKQKIRNRSFRL